MKSRVPMDEFRSSSNAQEIIFGPGSVNRLREANNVHFANLQEGIYGDQFDGLQ
jgi:hypothetical protein